MHSSTVAMLFLALVALFSFPLAFAEDISPICYDEFLTYDKCLIANSNLCDLCDGEDTEPSDDGEDTEPSDDGEDTEDTNEDICKSIPTFCDSLSCCAPCISAAKAFVACESDARECGVTCNEVQPVAPSPVAPIIPFATPSFDPFPVASFVPTVTQLCFNEITEFSFCFMENRTPECLVNCQPPEDDQLQKPETCEDEDFASALCSQFTCCPVCAVIGKRAVDCVAEEYFGCTEVSCGEFPPFAPSPIAPFILPPTLFGPPDAPVVPSKVPVAAPVAPVGKSDSSSEDGSSKDHGKKGMKKGKKGKKG